MGKTVLIEFDDIDAPVALTGCDDVLALFPSVLAGWPHRRLAVPDPQAEPFLAIEHTRQGYLLTSPFLQEPQVQSDPVNAICAMIAEMAWASLRSNPELLCVHGAAIEFAGRLVLVPSTRRAGKSTLTACLAARGHRVFTDDFLSIEIDGDNQPRGLASGVAPRLRLPLPGDFSTAMQNYAAQPQNPWNNQYCYLQIDEATRVPRAVSQPIGAIVLLHRESGAAASLQRASKADVLKTVIVQNFSRARNAGRILQVLHYLASTVELRLLRYSRAEDAVALLSEEFATWPAEATSTGLPADTILPAGEAVPENLVAPQGLDESLIYARSGAIVEYQVEDVHFLADGDGFAIHRLNEMSAAIWNILSEPCTLPQICAVFYDAFPDQPQARIESDIRRLLGDFARNRLIVPFPEHHIAAAAG